MNKVVVFTKVGVILVVFWLYLYALYVVTG